MAGKADSLRERLGMTAVWLSVALFVWCQGCPVALAEYAPEPIYDVGDATITKPQESDVWLAGSDHTVTCDFEDKDCNLETGELENDDVICTWDGASGSFKNGNIGESVDYICSDTSGTEWVEVTAIDAGTLAPDYWEPAYDCVTFSTIIPEVVEVNFQPAGAAYYLKTHLNNDIVSSSDVAEYTRDIGAANPTKNHSAVFLKNTPLSLKFKAAWTLDLTEGSDVDVSFEYVQGVPGDQEAESVGQAFGSWPYQSPAMTSSTYPFVNHISYENLFADRATYFYYRVPGGSNHWIPMPPTGIRHHLCVVARPPLYPEHYEWVARASCRAAHTEDSDTAETIVDHLYHNLAENARVRQSPDWEDDWTTELEWKVDPQRGPGVRPLLIAEDGECDNWCAYFIALCNVQGIGPNDGLKDGPFDFNENYPGVKWRQFCVDRKGINREDLPPAYACNGMVKTGKYPKPVTPGDVVGPHSRNWWVFADHGLVFLNDSLYDPSFAEAGEESLPVPWPGAEGRKDFSYLEDDEFICDYFWPTCPYNDSIPITVVIDEKEKEYAPGLWVETIDALDEEGSELSLHWDPDAGGRPEGRWW